MEKKKIITLSAKKLGLSHKMSGQEDSPTKILDVYTPITDKKNIVLKGTAKKIVGQIFEKFVIHPVP